MALLVVPEVPLCVAVPISPPTVHVRFPFDIKLSSVRSSINRIPGADELLLAQLGHLNALIAPFTPILVLAGLLLALVNCAKAIPDAITSLSPTPILNCLEELAKKLPLLMAFLPGIPYVILVRDILGILRRFLVELVLTLETIQAALARQLAGLDIAEALGDATLVAEIRCAAEDSRQQMVNLVAAFGVLNTVLCALAIPLAILEAFLPGEAKQQVKNLRCSIKDLIAIPPPAAIDSAREMLLALQAQVTLMQESLALVLQQIRALELIFAGLIGEELDVDVSPPDCFADCPPQP